MPINLCQHHVIKFVRYSPWIKLWSCWLSHLEEQVGFFLFKFQITGLPVGSIQFAQIRNQTGNVSKGALFGLFNLLIWVSSLHKQ